MAFLLITDATGQQWQQALLSHSICTIGRAPDNSVVLRDGLVSRHHAHIRFKQGVYTIVDGHLVGSQLKRSVNKVLINGLPREEHPLADGDQITIGSSQLRFVQPQEEVSLSYDDMRLGHTQIAISARDAIEAAIGADPAVAVASPDTDSPKRRRKADVLGLLYEMSKVLSSVFDLEAIFDKATDIIFRVTPADRVVALLADDNEANGSEATLRAVAARARDERLAEQAKTMSVARTVTRKVMRERVALLSQDSASDSIFTSQKSIASQGVRSTICAPLVGESGAYGALYADRLDPFEVFTRDDLELINAIAAQTAIAVQNVRAHRQLAREEVARANYSRFLPEYVVRQMLEHPESFQLGGTTQTITVLFADIRGFTRVAEHAPPERIVQLLNKYFSAMTEIIFARGGTLDKYIGDGLMALFGAPTATPDDPTHAIAAAVDMQRQVQRLKGSLRIEALEEISIGIGLHTGEAIVGYIGSERRSEYTAIGDTVNLAARLESNARGGQILISEAVAQAARGTPYPLRQQEALTVKNRVQPVPIYEVEWQPPTE